MRPYADDKQYRKKNIRFSRFEDFVATLIMEVEDKESRDKIRELFKIERDRVIERTNVAQ